MSKYSIVFSEDIGEYRKDVKKLLEDNDEEFVPPLSTRIISDETSQVEFDREKSSDIDNFFQNCIPLEYIFCIAKDSLVGFLAFDNNHKSKYLEGYNPSNYVSVILVKRDYRKQGIAESMYKKLINEIPEKYKLPYITTRTWSKNDAHTNLLEKLGFQIVTRIENDRGKNIDTLYYGQKTKHNELKNI